MGAKQFAVGALVQRPRQNAGRLGSRVEIGSPHAVHAGRGSCYRTEAKCLLVKVSPPSYSKAAAPALLSFSNCEIATINCDMTKGFSIMILLGTP